jgi:peptidoglycan/LPS O-acetylase OafA/YrhL
VTAAIEPRAQLPTLTGIRGIAAWMVVLFHVRVGIESQLPEAMIRILAKGYLAVDLFFLLSGFVLWLNYADRLRGTGAGGGARFMARRIARIWPLHLFILGWAAAFALVLALTGRADPDQFPWAEFPFHLLLVQNWGFSQALHWNDPAWSISCEFAAYLLFPLLVAATDWRGFSSAALILLLILLALTLHLVMVGGGQSTLGDDIVHFGLPRALVEFTMGTLVCVLWTRWQSHPNGPRAGVVLAGAALLAALLSGSCPETLGVPLFFAAMLLVISLTAPGPANPLSWPRIHYLGEISYATYLVHFLLYILFKILFVGDPEAVPLPLVALFLMMVLGASIALHHIVERPAQRALNRAFDSMTARRSAPAGGT